MCKSQLERDKLIRFRETDIRQPIVIASTYYKNPVCVEVGVNEGVHAEVMYALLRPNIMYLVDPWYGGQKSIVDDKFKDKSNVMLIQDYSEPASKVFSDNDLDLVYIDANHVYKDVILDLNSWYPKLKIGGMLCGHDANREEVYMALDEFSKKQELELNLSDNARNFWFIKEQPRYARP